MLSAHVPFQRTRFTKSFIALIAFVRSLVRVNTHVFFQSTRFTKSFIAHITFIRFLVRVNTHVNLQSTRFTKTLLAHIAFVRFLFRVRTYVCSQTGWSIKHLPANIALVPSLSLHSSSNKSRFLFSLLILLRHDITTRHAREHPPQSLHVSFFFSSLLLPKIALQNRPRVHRALRVWILFSHLCFSFFFFFFFFFFFLYHKHTRAENQSQEGMEFEVMRSEV